MDTVAVPNDAPSQLEETSRPRVSLNSTENRAEPESRRTRINGLHRSPPADTSHDGTEHGNQLNPALEKGESKRSSLVADAHLDKHNEGDEIHDVDSDDGREDDADQAQINLEKGITPLARHSTQKSYESMRSQHPAEANIIGWDGPDDPENPKNWNMKRKWAAVFIVSSFTFISPVASSMVAPALPDMQRELNVGSDILTQMMLSIFLLAYAIGPLFLGPLFELYGRVPVLQLANLFFLVFNLGCGFARTGAEMLVLRFLSGLGGSAPLAIGGGVLADCFHPEQRGKAIAMYSLAPLIGPAIGPVAGGFITEHTTWRWVFWAVSIADAAIQISGLFFLQETWAPKLLERKAARLRKSTGNDNLVPVMSNVHVPLATKLRQSIERPFRLLSTQPIIIAIAIYMTYLYGLVYLVVSSFSALWMDRYHQSVQISGLHYIALALGYFIGAQASSRFNDWIYKRLKQRNNGKGRPEFRVPAIVSCSVLLPIGFFWYGWSAQARVFWIMPDIGVTILGAAVIAGYYAMQAYVIDAYPKYAASAMAAISALRSCAGFGFPLFAPAMYNTLGYGWANSLLAFIAIVIGLPAPWLFWRYGEQLRARSRYAAGAG